MKISGFNGGNGIISVNAKLRLEKGWFDGACITGTDKQFVVSFTGKDADWKGQPLFLCSSRNPHEPRIFRSIDGAVSELARIGISNVRVISEATDSVPVEHLFLQKDTTSYLLKENAHALLMAEVSFYESVEILRNLCQKLGGKVEQNTQSGEVQLYLKGTLTSIYLNPNKSYEREWSYDHCDLVV